MKSKMIVLFSSIMLSTAIQAEVPDQIIFNNQTSLSLSSAISTFPGQGIAPNTTKAVSYYLVNVGCYYSVSRTSCPIEFTDKANGAKVATVYINADTATLTQPPVFYGNYANEYEVLGWEASPIREITITAKA